MKQIFASVLILMGMLGQVVAQSNKTQPMFKPGEIWRDTNGEHINAHGGGMLFHKGRYYWFGEHKVAGREGNKALVGVSCYSSKDLNTWKNEGPSLSVDAEGSGSEIEKGSVIERPKVIYNEKTRKFVMWFHLELKGQGYSAARTGVAVADKVTGPYTYLKSVRPHAGVWPENATEAHKTEPITVTDNDPDWEQKVAAGAFLQRDFKQGQMSRDMTLFVDDDGTAYHIASSEENRTLHIGKLKDDYLSFTDEYVRVFPGGRNEAPAIFKKDGKYYMITSGLTGWAPNPARSAVSDNMMRGWKSLGNPVRGTEEELSTTFLSQSTYVLPVQGQKDAFIFMADRWRPNNPIDGRYIWLPVFFEDGKPVLRWLEEWTLSDLKPKRRGESRYAE
ncbi:glycoside hydrolase family 43 protein [Pontibacter sp. E15-1]|uniref:glycoside hydrolase family 43 protein n=1 Tax=Pontibacter sp. E15-1 TaxID=2919918 RepID=UPI001F4F5560|nr:glycoside hydrolase family 43 protein [Pontibacter sp. E15-1]MCJ8164304.1 glycoside hydrolase family 43 protein [Pontibacter sp. E15-1]